MQKRLENLPSPRYAFAIGTSEAYKQWGKAHYAELAQRLIERGAGVVLIGGPAEAQLAQDIEAIVPQDLRHGLAIVTDAPVLGSAALLQRVNVCVGNDTGMVNVAAAVGTTTFVLIGHRRTLDHDPEHLFNVQAASLAEVTVEQVFELITSRVPIAEAAA